MKKCLHSLLMILIIQSMGCAQIAFYQAEKHHQKKHYYKSIAAYLKFAQNYADHKKAPEALYKAAKLQQEVLLDNKQAYESYTMLVDRFPVGSYTLLAQEEIANLQKDVFRRYDQAIIEYEKLLDIAPNYDNIYKVKKAMAECYVQLNQHQQAQIEYAQLLETYPEQANRADIYFAMANNAYVGGMPKKSIEYFHKVLEQAPDKDKKGQALFGIASAYGELDDFEKAKSYYLQAREFYPSPEVVNIRLLALKKRSSKKFK